MLIVRRAVMLGGLSDERRGRDVPEQSIDLIDHVGVTALLIAKPLLWRIRAVEQIEIRSATATQRTRSLQVAPLAPVLDEVVSVGAATRAWIALNVAPMPRGPLLDFSIEGPLGQASLLPRIEIGVREAAFIDSLATAAGAPLASEVLKLLESALALVPNAVDVEDERGLTSFILDGTGLHLSRATAAHWLTIGRECRALLEPRSDAPSNVNAVMHPALVVPDLYGAGVINSIEEAGEVLRRYRDWLRRLDAVADSVDAPTAEDEILNSVADYASNYDLLAAMEVPLRKPFIVKYSEQREMPLRLWRNWATQSLVTADAQSNHVSLQVDDPNVRIRKMRAVGADGSSAFGSYATRKSQQLHAFYATSADRDYRVILTFRLAVLARLLFVPYVVVLAVFAIAIGLASTEVESFRDAALLVAPAALASSILLTREPSTLGARLRVLSYGLTVLSLVCVVGVGIWKYLASL
jgi:hypothetical protein